MNDAVQFIDGQSAEDFLGNTPSAEQFLEAPSGLTAAETLRAAGQGIAETYGPHALADDVKRAARGAVRATGQAFAGVARLNQRLQDTLVDINPLVPSADQEHQLRQSLGEGDNATPTIEQRMKAANAVGAQPAVNAGKSVERLSTYYQPDPARDRAFTANAAEFLGSVAPIVASGPAAPATGAGMLGEQVREGALAAGDAPDVADAKATLAGTAGAAAGMLPGGTLLRRVATPRLAVVAPAAAAALQIGGDAALAGAGGTAFDAGYQQLVNGQVDWHQALKTGGLVAFIGGIGGALKANAAQKLATADREGLIQAARPLGFEGKTFDDLQQWYKENESAAQILAGGKQQNARGAAPAADEPVPAPSAEQQAAELEAAHASDSAAQAADENAIATDEATGIAAATEESRPWTDGRPVETEPVAAAGGISRGIEPVASAPTGTASPALMTPAEFAQATDDAGKAARTAEAELATLAAKPVGQAPSARIKRMDQLAHAKARVDVANAQLQQLGGPAVHFNYLQAAVMNNEPVSAAAWDSLAPRAGLALPANYARQRDQYAPIALPPDNPDTSATEVLAEPRDAAVASVSPTPVNPGMPQPPPGVPQGLHQNARMPVTMEPIVSGQVDAPTVMQAYEQVVRAAGGNAPIRTGRFYQKANGIFKTFEDVIRIRDADNLPTAAHEVAHAVSKQLFGGVTSQNLVATVRATPPALKTARPVDAVKVKRELESLGHQLYGGQRPAAGYAAEGFSELLRKWLTTESASKAAPESTRWLEEALLPKHPELAGALKHARDLTDVWRGQGALRRATAMMKDAESRFARLRANTAKVLSRRAMVEEFSPLEELSNGFTKLTGRRLRPHEDPFLLASAKRGSAGQMLDTWVQHGMTDVWGNITGPSLKEAIAPIRPNRATDFAVYLWARRALERWSKGMNPGMAREDALYLRDSLEQKFPEFVPAAAKYYDWWNGVLDYLKQAAPEMNGALVDAIRASSKNYVPLGRVIDENGARMHVARQTGGGLYKFHGSGRPIRNIWLQTLLVAEKLIQRAHKDMVLDSVFRLSKTEGMGWLVEKVPLTRVMKTVNIENLRRELEAGGVDTSGIPADTLLTYATHLDKPAGADPIMVRRTASGPEWYQVPAAVYEVLEGIAPARLPWVADLLLGVPARVFKLGTTGLRASFSVVTNPARDWQNFMLQSAAGNPAKRAAWYFRALHDVLRAGLTGRESPEWKLFHQLAITSGNFLGGDIQQARRASRALFHGRVYRRVMAPVETLRELLSFSESVPRLAELALMGRDFGWRPGQPMTPEQAVAMTVAAKRVTTDFSAGGSVGKLINQAVPFFNANIQGTRAAVRAFKADQGVKQINRRWLSTALKGMALLTLPVLWNWWRNKDREWYRFLPWRERYLYTNIEDKNGNIWQIPRPQEAGNLFMVAPEMLLDQWYLKDPAAVSEGLAHMFALQNPVDYPVILRAAKEQWQNRIDFFDRPIVPRGQLDIPPGEQRSPYTTALANALGNAFPNTISPRRVDAAIRSLFGGVGADLTATPDALMRELGLRTTDLPQRDPEAADLPVIGRLFRRGGGVTANAQPLADFWDDFTRYSARWMATQQAAKNGRQPIAPIRPEEIGYLGVLRKLEPVIKIELQIADRTPDLVARQRLYRSAAEQASAVLRWRPSEERPR